MEVVILSHVLGTFNIRIISNTELFCLVELLLLQLRQNHLLLVSLV